MARPAASTAKDVRQRFVGTWTAADEGDANFNVTVAFAGDRPRVKVEDAFDGETMKVSKVSFDGTSLRFATLTPSTGARLEHELRARAGDKAEYRFTVVQAWERLPDEGG